MKLIIYADGGSRGNPGQAGIGYVLRDGLGNIILQKGEKIGVATNNEAEYWGIITALEKAGQLTDAFRFEVKVFLDSKLVVEQLSGNWKIKQPHLVKLAIRAKRAEKKFACVSYQHIPREKNALADSLLNKALDN